MALGITAWPRVLTSILPVRASPGIWLSPLGHADLTSLVNDPSLYIFWSFPLKLLTNFTAMDSTSNIFQILITLSVKKCWRNSVWTLLLCNFMTCPLICKLWERSKNVLKATGENPWIILNTLMRSALTRLCSNDHNPVFDNLSSHVIIWLESSLWITFEFLLVTRIECNIWRLAWLMIYKVKSWCLNVCFQRCGLSGQESVMFYCKPVDTAERL